MSRKLDYAEMKQIMQQYFLLLSGKRAMKADLPMGGFELKNWAQVLSNFQYPNALLLDGSREMLGDLPFKVLRGVDPVSHIRTRQVDDSMLDFSDWYVNAWRNIMTIYSGRIDIHSCGYVLPVSASMSIGSSSKPFWEIYGLELVPKWRVRFTPQADFPGNPTKGDVCCLNATNKLYFYNGALWEEVSSK